MPIKGVVRFKSLNSLMNEVTFMDIETYREIFGYYTAQDVVETLPRKGEGPSRGKRGRPVQRRGHLLQRVRIREHCRHRGA